MSLQTARARGASYFSLHEVISAISQSANGAVLILASPEDFTDPNAHLKRISHSEFEWLRRTVSERKLAIELIE